jgi:hypothetical protein
MMKSIHFAVLALALAAPASAGGFFHHNPTDQLAIRGYDEPCTVELPVAVLFVALAGGVDVSTLKRADFVFQGEGYNGCWAPLDEDGKVFMVDELGGAGFIQVGVAI